MPLNLPKNLCEEDVYRQLGMRGALPDASTKALVQRACEMTLQNAVPRMAWRSFSCDALKSILMGNDIAKHLEHCNRCVLLAVTLGIQMDAFQRKMAVEDMAAAVAIDAAASVLAEALAEQAEQQLRAEQRQKGCYLTGRYSPGYGDFPIAVQNQLITLLDAPRAIGLFVTDSHLLTPRKSITAVCGISEVPVTGKHAGCVCCALRETCCIRKEGKRCDT